jgi:glycerophosphoryl diester phosphodiesterase
MNSFWGSKKFKPPWFIAHRGYRAKYPENTLIAFQAALDAGVQMIELDVALSRDRKLVVIHDATLERTTNGKGAVSDHTLAQLKQLDAGGWFHARFAGEHLPELSEVLDLVDGQVMINIEIKPHAYEPRHPLDAVERQTLELVCRRNIAERRRWDSSQGIRLTGILLKIANSSPLYPGIPTTKSLPPNRSK